VVNDSEDNIEEDDISVAVDHEDEEGGGCELGALLGVV